MTEQEIIVETQPKRSEKQKPKRLYFTLWAIFIILFGLTAVISLWWCSEANIFQIKSIEIYGTRLINKNDIIQKSGIKKGSSLLTLKIPLARTNIEEIPYVRLVNISRRFPDKVIIQILERKPFCYIALKNLYLVDSTSVILPIPYKEFKANLPVITGFEYDSLNLIIGKRSNNLHLKKALEILQIAKNQFPHIFTSISEIHFDQKGNFILFTIEGGTPIFLKNKNFAKQFHILTAFQEALRGKRTFNDYEFIDLRWEKQVIVKERKL